MNLGLVLASYNDIYWHSYFSKLKQKISTNIDAFISWEDPVAEPYCHLQLLLWTELVEHTEY